MNGARVVLAVAAILPPVPAQFAGEVRWRVPDGGVAFGEPFGVELVVPWPAGAVPEPPDAAAFGPIALATDDGAAAGPFRAVAWAAGGGTLPPFELRAVAADGATLRALVTAPPLSVRSVLPAPDPGLEWPAPFAASPAPTSRTWWWLVAGAVGLGSLVLWWRRAAAPVSTPVRAAGPSADALALAALDRLLLPDATADAAAVLAFYRDIVAIVGAFAGRRSVVPAATRTSEELVAQARGDVAALADCLSRCDAVKFAAHRPGPADHVAAREAAVRFVRAEAV